MLWLSSGDELPSYLSSEQISSGGRRALRKADRIDPVKNGTIAEAIKEYMDGD
jgi:hypothetical protein